MIACEYQKIYYWQTHVDMNAYQEIEIISSTAKLVDASKYNLRCNRNISEKMTKKDFVYDIRTPVQTMRKVEMQKRSIILPIQLRRKQNIDSKVPQYTVIPEKLGRNVSDGSGDATVIAEQRILGYKCNYCHEPIATLLSLSTHVKFHCQKHCKICYWILRENETMEQHIINYHCIRPEIVQSVNLNKI
ncbi:uncharacterized protein LOC116846635 [Odontomachus brunneus]|uniref:uncharacterized protein LOC116846635 n=1 Tax=Odontomachus brunneus TaxID=486640 RepID=UPI0013F25748|nr:uncharacterized protein LOC116846635 [Odontomachus brunneus]